MNYDRIILELLDRVSALEDEVTALKAGHPRGDEQPEDDVLDIKTVISRQKNDLASRGRDTTKYLLGGRTYGKNRLVLAVVKKYVEEHPGITAEELISTFDRSLQGSFGVVRILDDVKKMYADYERRFFTARNEIIHTPTGICVVCTQWGKFNINSFVKRANQLNFDIAEVK